VCPIDPFDSEKVNETAYRTLAGYDSNYEEFVPFLEMLTRLSYDDLSEASDIVAKTPKIVLKNQMTLRQLGFKVAIKCDEFLHHCKYRGEVINCCEFFEPIYSERGFCYSFNARYNSTAEQE